MADYEILVYLAIGIAVLLILIGFVKMTWGFWTGLGMTIDIGGLK